MPRIGKSLETESRPVIPRAGRFRGKWRMTGNGYDVSFHSKIDYGDGLTTMNTLKTTELYTLNG